MEKKKLNELAKEIANLDMQHTQDNTSEIISKIENLIKDCSFEDLLEIDNIIQEKYLTN